MFTNVPKTTCIAFYCIKVKLPSKLYEMSQSAIISKIKLQVQIVYLEYGSA